MVYASLILILTYLFMYLRSRKIVPFTLFLEKFINKAKRKKSIWLSLKLITRNQRIHQMTSKGWYELRVDMSDFNNESRFAYYRIFSVGNKDSGYKLTVGEYKGNAGKKTLHNLL